MRLAAVLASLALAGCAAPGNPALEQARAAYRAAQSDPQVARHTAAELDDAGRALSQAARNDADPREAAHQAYLAEQRSRIARELAQARVNDAEFVRRYVSEDESAGRAATGSSR